MKTKFTPGPWRWTEAKTSKNGAFVNIPDCPNPVQTLQLFATKGQDHESACADAALISAAPDLHAVVVGMLESSECNCGNIASDAYKSGLRCWHCQGIKALAKARGA